MGCGASSQNAKVLMDTEALLNGGHMGLRKQGEVVLCEITEKDPEKKKKIDEANKDIHARVLKAEIVDSKTSSSIDVTFAVKKHIETNGLQPVNFKDLAMLALTEDDIKNMNLDITLMDTKALDESKKRIKEATEIIEKWPASSENLKKLAEELSKGDKLDAQGKQEIKEFSKDLAKSTPLHEAASNNCLQLTRLLLSTGKCDVNKMGTVTYTNDRFVKQNLKGSPYELEELIPDGDAPAIVAAAISGRPEICRGLLACKADLKKNGPEGYSALHAAALANKPENVKILVGAMECKEGNEAAVKFVNSPNAPGDGKKGIRALPICCVLPEHYKDNITALLNLKADPNQQNEGEGFYPIHLAAFSSNTSALKMLLDAKADIAKTDNEGTGVLNLSLGSALNAVGADEKEKAKEKERSCKVVKLIWDNIPEDKWKPMLDAKEKGTPEGMQDNLVSLGTSAQGMLKLMCEKTDQWGPKYLEPHITEAQVQEALKK